jgi:hypothetical protein
MRFWYTINPPGCNIPGTEILRHVPWDTPATMFDKCLTLIPKAGEAGGGGLLSIAIQADGLLSTANQAFTVLF